MNCIGKSETLKHYSPTRYSRRVNDSDRLVYDVVYDKETGKSTLRIFTYKFHYIDYKSSRMSLPEVTTQERLNSKYHFYMIHELRRFFVNKWVDS